MLWWRVLAGSLALACALSHAGVSAELEDDLMDEILKSEGGHAEEEPASKPERPRRFKSYRQAVHPLTDMPDAEEHVETNYYFPEFPDLRLPIGESVTILCHIRNGGPGPLNLTYIMGSLNLPYEFSYHIQNFTLKQVMLPLPSQAEATLEYQFKLHPQLEPSEFQIAHTVFYQNEEEGFSTTFFNKTCTLYHKSAEVDIVSTFRSIALLLALVGGLFLCFKQSSKKDKPKPSSASGAGSSGDWDDIAVAAKGKGGKKGKSKKN